MIEGIPLSVADLSGYGLAVVLIAFLVVSLVRGWLITRLQYCTMEETMKYYREAHTKDQETISILTRTVEKQTVVNDIVVSTMTTMKRLQEQDQESGR